MSNNSDFIRLSQTCELDQRSLYLRNLIMRSIRLAGRGHVGPALSLVEIMRVLYDDIISLDPSNPKDAFRDRVILSKGHGCLALYSILADKGFFKLDELDTFCDLNSRLGGHPEFDTVPGVEASTGALGHGLSLGVGIALAGRMRNLNYSTYVIVGDGEINEGSVWEAALSAAKHKLGRLTVIIDCNKMQSYGSTDLVMPMGSLSEKWKSFGFNVTEVNGHDVFQLREALSFKAQNISKPNALICHTVKGKGLSSAENNAGWHHKNKLSEAEIEMISDSFGEI